MSRESHRPTWAFGLTASVLLATFAIERPLVAWLGDALLAGMILRPLQLALFSTAIGACHGKAKVGLVVGFGIFVFPVILFAAAVGLAYLI